MSAPDAYTNQVLLVKYLSRIALIVALIGITAIGLLTYIALRLWAVNASIDPPQKNGATFTAVYQKVDSMNQRPDSLDQKLSTLDTSLKLGPPPGGTTDALLPPPPISTLRPQQASEPKIHEVADLSTFASQAELPHQLDLDYLEKHIRAIIDGTTCHKVDTVGNVSFRCEAPSLKSDVSSCTFTWPLDSIKGNGPKGIAVLESGRADIISKDFAKGGYAWYGKPEFGADRDPKIGIAIVKCSEDREFRLAFIISNAEDTAKYRSLFRTRGYDWISRGHQQPPYLPEIFAMASIRKISSLISADPSADTLLANDKIALVDKDTIDALRKIPSQELTVGNNSDFGLGISRGACMLAVQAAGLPSSNVHISPSEVIEDYYYLTPSAVFSPAGRSPLSAPCPLVTAWLSLSTKPVEGFPKEFTSPYLIYKEEPAVSQRESLWRAYAVRTAAVMLYMFGYDVNAPTDKTLNGATGQWPRKQFR